MKRAGYIGFMLILFAAILCTPLFAQSSTTTNSQYVVSMDDFDAAVSLWNDAVQKDEYQHYLEKIIQMTSAEIEQEYYPFMLSELVFFRYFAPHCSSMPVFSELNKKADELIQTFLAFEKDSPETFIAHKLFEVVSRLYGNDDEVPPAENKVYKRTVELPDSAIVRKNLLDTISEAEAMYLRFSTMLAKQSGNVVLRFSGDAYTKTMNNPALVYVIVNEPTFGLLKEALEKSDNMTDSLILEDDAALYYNFVCNIAIAKTLFAKWGVPINSVLPEDISSLFIIADTEPFLLTCLDIDVMKKASGIASYLAACGDMYISRINRVVNSPGK